MGDGGWGSQYGGGSSASGTRGLYDRPYGDLLPSVLWRKALVCLSQAVCCADIFRTRVGNQLQMVSHDDTPSGGCCPTGDLKRRSLVTVTASLLAAATPTFTSPDVAPMQTRGYTPIFLINTLFTEVFFPIKSFETSVTSSLTLPRARYKYSKQISTEILQSLLKC